MQGSVETRPAGSRGLPPAAPGSASAVLGGDMVLRVADVDVAGPASGSGVGAWPGWPASSGWPPWPSGGVS